MNTRELLEELLKALNDGDARHAALVMNRLLEDFGSDKVAFAGDFEHVKR